MTVPTELTRGQAVRFLQRATFGGSPSDVEHLRYIGASAWLDEQLAMERGASHLRRRLDEGLNFEYLVWGAYLRAPDQLRRRWAYALSQVFVVSRISVEDQRIAAFADVLEDHCFGTYRSLLEHVTRSSAMGDYLTYDRNRREDARSGTVPDENYAREVMQLFTVGLWRLHPDGTRMTDGSGQPMPTYDESDILGLARVFTGFSRVDSTDPVVRYSSPMDSSGSFADRYHERGEKRFLDVIVPASGTRTLDESLAVALDTLAGHPNTAPFVSHQLIQRMVTSNPSAAYVGRVAAVFADDGAGVRGNLGAVLRAILCDPEAWQTAPPGTFGKLREPVLRMTACARALDVEATERVWPIASLEDASNELGQQPFAAPSVFNFYRPGYVPPQSALGDAGLVSPEMQLANETSTIGWVNFVARLVRRPPARTFNTGSPTEFRSQLRFDLDGLLALVSTEFVDAASAGSLVDEVAGRLCPDGLDPEVRTIAVSNVQSIVSANYRPGGTRADEIRLRDDIHLDRVVAAVMMIAVSTDFLIER